MAKNHSKESKQFKRKADDLSLRLYNLRDIAAVTAFAAESRRVLERISGLASMLPAMDKQLCEHVTMMNNWAEMQDSSGSVMTYVSDQIDEINQAFTQLVYDASEVSHG